MTGPTLAIVITTCGALDYAGRAIRSAVATACPFRIIVVDDASPDFRRWFNALDLGLPPGMRVDHAVFASRGGLLRSWNHGLLLARDAGAAYACLANSDVLFSPRWDEPPRHALGHGLDLVGPVTNAPGTGRAQDVRLYHRPPPAAAADAPDSRDTLARIAGELRREHGDAYRPGTINGFCMMARTDTWFAHPYDADRVFCPHNAFNSRGRPNPTPAMTLGEYELQRRWHAAGLQSGYCPGSYVFHYRSASRGERYRTAGSYRPGEETLS